MERLYRGFDMITNPVHTLVQQRQIMNYELILKLALQM
ncbi:hypothetical protein BDGGKGIB_03241 [Nodularia sphaerocarpa UHCC 0038]|nr:hypothetical protein BDGGKGIB_03241 [Nodularia sphaerocarpa UHCC 0038]